MTNNNHTQKFSKATIEELENYVYALVNSIDNKIFYIGRGKGNRIFSHQNNALKNVSEKEKISLKTETIRNIIGKKGKIVSYILRHGLEDREAREIEATLIDIFSFKALNLTELTNIAGGYNCAAKGIALTSKIEKKYSCKEISGKDFKHNVLIISANKEYDENLTTIDLYESVRKAWVVDAKRASAVEYIIIKYHGVLKEIYKLNKWVKYNIEEKTKSVNYDISKAKKKDRYAFEGYLVLDSNIRELYLHKKLDKRSYGSPLNYVENQKIKNVDEEV